MQPIFHEEFDIDIEANTESMFVPRFQLGLGARFFNDFNMVSAYVVGAGVTRRTGAGKEVLLWHAMLTDDVKAIGYLNFSVCMRK